MRSALSAHSSSLPTPPSSAPPTPAPASAPAPAPFRFASLHRTAARALSHRRPEHSLEEHDDDDVVDEEGTRPASESVPLRLLSSPQPPPSPPSPAPPPSSRPSRSLASLIDRLLRPGHRPVQLGEMKFSHSLKFNAVPEWSHGYINYSNLKKAIYAIEKEQALEGVSAQGAYHDEPDVDVEHESAALLRDPSQSEANKTFIPLLNKELSRIVEFYAKKESELQSDLQELGQDIEQTEARDLEGERVTWQHHESEDEDEDEEDDDDEDSRWGGPVSFGRRRSRSMGRAVGARMRASIDNLFRDPRQYHEGQEESRHAADLRAGVAANGAVGVGAGAGFGGGAGAVPPSPSSFKRDRRKSRSSFGATSVSDDQQRLVDIDDLKSSHDAAAAGALVPAPEAFEQSELDGAAELTQGQLQGGGGSGVDQGLAHEEGAATKSTHWVRRRSMSMRERSLKSTDKARAGGGGGGRRRSPGLGITIVPGPHPAGPLSARSDGEGAPVLDHQQQQQQHPHPQHHRTWGAGSLSLGGGPTEGRPLSVWTSETDYAIDLRITYKRRITDLFVNFSELKQFIQLNHTGFRKSLKKYDKVTSNALQEKYMQAIVEQAYPFLSSTLDRIDSSISTLIQFYAKIVTTGNADLALKQLRTHLREQIVWQRNTVWREMIGIERRARAVGLQEAVIGQAGRVGAGDEKKARLKLRTPCGPVFVPAWVGISSLQLGSALAVFFLFLTAPQLQFFERPEEQNCLALLLLCTILWATEVLPLFVTSLMVPLLVVVLRVGRSEADDSRLSAHEATKWIFSTMFAPNMCLLLGGFTIAAALSKYGIDRILATRVLSLAGTKPSFVLLAHMCVACFSSMWISNVAAPVLCYSLITPVLRTLPPKSPYARCLILGIALASNIGGQSSPIASPQNLIALEYMDPPLDWLQWFAIALPVSAVSLVLIWLLLLWSYGSGRGTTIHPIRKSIDTFTPVQYYISAVTLVTIALWCFETRIESVVGDMGIIAIIPLVAFFGTGVLTKEDFNNFLWTIVFLAMGGIALGKAVLSSGLLESMDHVIQSLVQGMPLWKILVILLTFTLVVATFISHTIAAVLLVPIAAQVGESLDHPHPRLLIMITALAASSAMGLPVSGFPNMNAISMENEVGQRYLSVADFLKNGIPASVVATVTVGIIGSVISLWIGL